jgi:hypothetical protein
MAAAMAHQGRAKRSTRCSEIDCKVGTKANQAVNPTAVPMRAAAAPTAAPLASMTRRKCRSVAPSEPSTPSTRSRRWAITVNPATPISPTNSSPRLPSASTMTSAEVLLRVARELVLRLVSSGLKACRRP